MDATLVKTNAAEIRARRGTSDADIDAMIELRAEFGDEANAEIAEHETAIAQHNDAIALVKRRLIGLGFSAGNSVAASINDVALVIPAQVARFGKFGPKPLDALVVAMIDASPVPMSANDIVAKWQTKPLPIVSSIRTALSVLHSRKQIRRDGVGQYARVNEPTASVAIAGKVPMRDRVLAVFAVVKPGEELRAREVQRRMAKGAPVGSIHTALSTLCCEDNAQIERVSAGLYRAVAK